MSKLLRYAAIFFLLSGILLFLGLIGAFVISIFRRSFSPWWFWPLGLALCVTLGVLFQFTMFAADYPLLKKYPYYPFGVPSGRHGLSPAAPPAKPYRWGKAQGWTSIALGLFTFAAVPNAAMLITWAIYIVAGIGLIRRRRYGFVLVYVLCALWCFLLLATVVTQTAPNREFYPLAVISLLFWCVPASSYYPRRWREISG